MLKKCGMRHLASKCRTNFVLPVYFGVDRNAKEMWYATPSE